MDLRNDTMLVLADLIGFPTITPESNLDLIDYARTALDAVGARITLTYDDDHDKANLFATIGPDIDGGVVLSGHTDVVPAEPDDWMGAPFLAARRDQRIYGRGATDMKGFIACALAMAPAFAAADLQVPIHLALTFDDEVGCLGAPLLLAQLGRTGPKPSAVIVGEPTSMRIIDGHKGCYEFTTTITGQEGHGSAPLKAVNAVEYAVRYVTRLLEFGPELRQRALPDSPYEPPETTISVGTINGGTFRNVVAGACSFDWEMRPVVQEDADHVGAALTRFQHELLQEMLERTPHASIVTQTVGAVGGLEPRADSPALRLVRTLLDRPDEPADVVSFGTEAGLYQLAGIPAVVCGPGSIDVAHRPDEYVDIEQLEACLAMMQRLGDHLRRG